MRKFACIIGHPIHNSLTPTIQQAAFAATNTDIEYFLWDTPEDMLEEQIRRLREAHCVGAQLSTPYRTYFMTRVDDHAPSAVETGACNVITSSGGRLTAHNTDVIGLRQSLVEDEGFDPTNKRILVLGAGGAARSALAVLRKYTGVETTVWDHNPETLQALRNFEDSWRSVGIQYSVCSAPLNSSAQQQALRELARDVDLIIHATPVGMSSGVTREQSLLTADMIPLGCLVFDVVANPLVTMLLFEARKAGARRLGGLPMLLHACAAAFKLWTGREEAPLYDMEQAALKEFDRQRTS